jgi:hypothetical protein
MLTADGSNEATLFWSMKRLLIMINTLLAGVQLQQQKMHTTSSFVWDGRGLRRLGILSLYYPFVVVSGISLDNCTGCVCWTDG